MASLSDIQCPIGMKECVERGCRHWNWDEGCCEHPALKKRKPKPEPAEQATLNF